MTSFTFSPPSSPVARAWLQALADFLRDASPTEQRHWLANWLTFMREAPLSGTITASSRALVIVTLERWQSEISERHAA